MRHSGPGDILTRGVVLKRSCVAFEDVCWPMGCRLTNSRRLSCGGPEAVKWEGPVIKRRQQVIVACWQNGSIDNIWIHQHKQESQTTAPF